MERIFFDRVLVEVDVTRQLQDTMKMTDPQRRVLNQIVWYDYQPVTVALV